MEINNDEMHKLVNQNAINNLSRDTLQQILKFLPNNDNINLKALADENNCNLAVVNDAYVNIQVLMTEAAKYDYNLDKFIDALNKTRIQKSHVQLLCEAYELHRKLIRGHLQVLGSSNPHIVEVTWKLEDCVKTSTSPSGIPRYSVFLTTIQNNKQNIVKFSCNMQQFQDLVLKLKSALHHLEKISST